MGKREFLELLSGKLAEELPRSLVISHLQYYENYIESELKSGKKIAVIMEELGDPIMIAHTIINTETGESFQGYAEDAEYVEIPKEETANEYTRKKDSKDEEKIEFTHLETECDKEQDAKEYDTYADVQRNAFQPGCLIAGIVIVLVLVAILSFVGGLIGTLLPILLPVIVIFIVISYVFGTRR